jgi:hypothetical protein
VSITGEAWEVLGSERLPGVVRSIKDEFTEAEGVRCTRVDIAFDGVELSPRDCERARMQGRVRMLGGFELRMEFLRNDEGSSWYLGNRKDRTVLLCLYDRRGFNRLEVRMYREWALMASQVAEAEGVGGLAEWTRGLLHSWADIGSVKWRRFVGPGKIAGVVRKAVERSPAAERLMAHIEADGKALAKYVALRSWGELQGVVQRSAKLIGGR